MRKTVKTLLILLLVTLFTCVFVACGEVEAEPIEDVPPPTHVGGNGSNSGDGGSGDGGDGGDGGNVDVAPVDPTSGTPVYLTFSYLKQAPSVFKHIYVEDFDIADIEYHVTYECIVGGKKQYLAGEGTPLSMDLLTKESRDRLENFGKNGEISGHFFIFVEYDAEYTDAEGNVKTKTVEGSFAMHMKTRAALLEFVTLKFELNGGEALFGNYSSADGGTSTIVVEKGQTWTWNEFISDFPVYREGYAIDSVTVDGKTYNASPETTITINDDATISVGWTENVMPINFDINLPDGVTNWTPVDKNLLPENFNEANGTWSLPVEKGEGFIPRPSVNNIATLEGYTFAGWRTANGTVWNFNKRAGNEEFTLYAMWTIRTYSVKYVLMGGEFNANEGYSDTEIASLKKAGIDVNYALGYGPEDPEYDPDSTRDMLAFKPYIVTFTGIPYGANLADYFATCKVRSDEEGLISISADPTIYNDDEHTTLATQITKSDDCYKVEGWYTESSYNDDELYTPEPVTEDLVLYPKWSLREDLSEDKLNRYFAEKLFNYTVKSDGTLRIDLIIDTSVSELVIPDSVYINDKPYIVTEIGEGAIMNVKTLITVDMSGAKSLTRIGKNAFAYCPNLREVIIPDTGLNVTYIGENAFRGTEFINGYKTATGNDFAVIGSVLVKYVGDTNATSINVDTASALLENVDTIAPGAFSELTALETVTIGDGIKYIYDKAFYKDTALATVLGGGGLEYVASDAFDQTAYVSTPPVNDPATTTDESTFLRIGSIYYRYVGTGKSAEIPAGVKVIAPNAFSTGHLIENITFGDASQIKSIGTDAFANTKWISENHTTAETGDANTFVQDGFVVINGILIAKRGRDAVVELPDLVRVIATGAFDNAYVTNLTITADSHLELIERDAFNGASNLKAISFINATDSVFVNFNDGAFSNENGEVINDEFKIYLYQAPITTLRTAVSDSDSDAVKAWKELYKGASEMFAVLKTNSARINSEIGLPTEYLFDGAEVDFVSVWDSLGLLNAEKTHIVDGKIVVRSDGVESKEDLAVVDVKTLAEGREETLDGTVGEGKTMSFEVDEVQADGYTYSVYPAIKASTMTVWYEADDGEDVEGLPTFYTTQSNFNEEGYVIKIKFNYNDATGSQDEIFLTDDMVTVTGYTPVYGVNKTLQIDVDYHGLAVYRVNAEYSVKKPQSVSIEQCSEMAISINALTAEINSVARNVLLKVTMSDGTFKYVNIDGKATFISVDDAKGCNAIAEEVSLDTTNLGYHTVGLRYGAPGDYVYCTVLYSVTLNTDGSMFNYTIDGDNATITSLKSGYDSTIAIPARVRLTDNGVYNPDSANEYTVVAIGDGAFKDRTNLEYVYIPATIKAIGNEAFMGCTDLKQIRSFTVTEAIDCGLSTSLVTFTEKQAKYLGEVTITGVAEGVKGEIEIPATVTYNKVLVVAGADGVDLDATYVLDETYVLDVKLDEGALAGYNGAIVLPDTDYFRGYAEANLGGKDVTFYTEGNGDKASNFVFSNYDDPVITYAYMTGDVIINHRANFTVTDGVIVIPESLVGSKPAEGSSYAYEYDYNIIGIKEQAFASAYEEEGMRTIYLPNSLRYYEGELEYLFGTGNYDKVTQHVYDVREDAIYAPSNAFPNVETIGNKAFYGCTSLGDLDFSLATDLNHLGNYAFYGCTAVVNMDLSATKITAIEASTFSGCTTLEVVKLPTTVTEIGDLAFDWCTALTKVEGTASVTYVGAYAFHNCTALTSISVPEGATVADTAFDGTNL